MVLIESQEWVVEKCVSLKLRSPKSKVKQTVRDHYLKQTLTSCVQKKVIPMFCFPFFFSSFRPSSIRVCIWKCLEFVQLGQTVHLFCFIPFSFTLKGYSWLWGGLFVWPSVSHLTFLCISLLICKRSIIIIGTPRGLFQI